MNLVKKWDSLPVKGWVAVAVTVVGGALAGTAAITSGSTCNNDPLRHVYQPSRLQVLASCQMIKFLVVAWRHEHDGDYHVNGVVEDDASWVNPVNVRRQHGYTVVEFVPGDPRPAKFYAGEELELQTTKVLDRQHGGWIEGHPVFSVRALGGRETGPDQTKLAPQTEDER